MQNKNYKTVCLVAGASGGHITPALMLGAAWKKQNPDGTIFFFGTSGAIDKTVLSNEETIKPFLFPLIKIPGKKIWLYPLFFVQFLSVFFKGLYHLHHYRPEKIISTGSIISIPVVLAGRVLRINVELYEPNAVPGKTIKFLAPFAQKVFVTFERSKQVLKNAIIMPYPLRFTEKDKMFDKARVIEALNKEYPSASFSADNKTIFLLGGSKGSVFLNTLLQKFVEQYPNNIQIIHQAGSEDKQDWKKFYADKKVPAITFAYHDNVKPFYHLADVVICRSGAGTLFELEFFQKPSIIVPLKSLALNHQVENAEEIMARNKGLFVVLDQDSITKDFSIFSKAIQSILKQLI